MSLVRSNTGENQDSEDQGLMFWKKRVKPVPGWPRAWKEVRSSSQQKLSSSKAFQRFQESVSDAWEVKEDCYNLLDKEISEKKVHSTSLGVINGQHSKTLFLQSSIESGSSSRPENAENYVATKSKSEDSVMVHNYSKCKNNRHSFQGKEAVELDGETTLSKAMKFQLLLESNLLNLKDLRLLSWSGIPMEVRPIAWRLLAGYLPASLERRPATMERKRLDYWNLVKQYFNEESDESFQATYRQIQIDIPRMSTLTGLFKQKTVQEMFERILLIWAIRHPASGYVQGINDLVTPFYVVFLQEFLPAGTDLHTFQVNSLPKEYQDIIEADSFWCLSKFLDGIQDNYIFAQLGIQRKVNQLRELIQRMDGTLHEHLQILGIDYLQFSFRWMNNLLTRELPLGCSIRLWDTYLAESDAFANFHLYVCAAFLLYWRGLLLQQDFQKGMMMLQKLPTDNWTEADVGVLVAEAYRLKFTFGNDPNDLKISDDR